MSISVFQSTLLQLLYIASAFGSISWSTSHTRSEAPDWAVNWPLLLGPGTGWTSFLLCTPSTKETTKISGGKVRAVARVKQNLDLVLSQIVSHFLSFMWGGIVMEQIHPASFEVGRPSLLHVVNHLGQDLASIAFTIDVFALLKHLYSNCALTIKKTCKHLFLWGEAWLQNRMSDIQRPFYLFGIIPN